MMHHFDALRARYTFSQFLMKWKTKNFASDQMPKSIVTRGMYVAFFFLAAVAMYILNFWSYKLLSFVPVLDKVCQHDNQWSLHLTPHLHTFSPGTHACTLTDVVGSRHLSLSLS
jgi:hypothetical protein